MSVIQGGPGRGRYLVSGTDTRKLSDFVSGSSGNPDLQLLDTVGPPGAPHTAVFDMSHDQAAALQRHFAADGDLKIEPDQPLSMFGDTPSGN